MAGTRESNESSQCSRKAEKCQLVQVDSFKLSRSMTAFVLFCFRSRQKSQRVPSVENAKMVNHSWEGIDDAYHTWLLNAPVSAAEFDRLSPMDQRSLWTQFKYQNKSSKQREL
eukprot:scaffold109541_cov50-Attheya_sp.AAC.7